MDEVDFDNVIEEIEALGRSEKSELRSRLSLILSYLLKWKYQPTMRGHSWKYALIEHRMMVEFILEDNLSLKNDLNKILKDAYIIARLKAAGETSLSEEEFPKECPYTFDEIMNNEFYPE